MAALHSPCPAWQWSCTWIQRDPRFPTDISLGSENISNILSTEGAIPVKRPVFFPLRTLAKKLFYFIVLSQLQAFSPWNLPPSLPRQLQAYWSWSISLCLSHLGWEKVKTDLIIISFGLICEIGGLSFSVLEPGEEGQKGRGG